MIIAFSMYSKIPVPQFEWKEENMKYVLCFFPWVGAVIGMFVWLWGWFCIKFSIGGICHVLIGTAIPLVVTGGFHIDGYMDTMDAFHSYKTKKQKLDILKDSHIGAFSVIMLVLYYMIYMGAYSEITNLRILSIFSGGFFLSRTLSGIAVVSFPSAKADGTMHFFADNAQKTVVRISLYVQLFLCMLFLMFISVKAGSLILIAAGLSFTYYYYRTRKEIGGITGDTAGYFVTICEAAIVVAAAVCK